jgi:integrase
MPVSNPYPIDIQNACIMPGMTTTTAQPIKLTFHRAKGLFKKCIGTSQGEDGKVRPRIFWLGRDQGQALLKARLLMEHYREMLDDGRPHWTADDIKAVEQKVGQHDQWQRLVEKMTADKIRQTLEAGDRFRLGANPDAPPITSAPAVAQVLPAPAEAQPPAHEGTNTTPKAATLYAGMKAFLDSFKAKRKSVRHKQRMEQVLNVNLKHVRQDCPLAEIDYLWLDRLCDHFKSRPANQKDGKPLSPSSVKGILTYLRLFFTWMDDVEYCGWEMPRKAAKCFKVRVADLMTPAECREAGTIKQFDTATLRKLYSKASDRDKSIILAGLFCGLTQHELAVLEKSEIDLDNATITHIRHKTKVRGTYWIPPELVTLLRAEFDARPDDALVWRTAEGRPLVSYGDNGQTSDAVRQMWDDLREKAEVPTALPFKHLRKYLADFCTAHGGEEMGQVAMAHSRQTVLSRNYSTARPFEKFHALQKQMHAHLTAGKFFEPLDEQNTKKKAKGKKAKQAA